MSHHDSRPTITAEQMAIPAGHWWNRIPLVGAIVGFIGLGLSLVLAASQPEQFYFSWLVAFMFYLSLALGGLFFVLTHYVTRASWSVVVRRLAENIMATLPLFILLFIPIILGMHDLYHWSHEDAAAQDELLRGKQAFLNTPFFLWRAAGYLVCWSAMAWWFSRSSVRQDETGDIKPTLRMIQLSAPALFSQSNLFVVKDLSLGLCFWRGEF